MLKFEFMKLDDFFAINKVFTFKEIESNLSNDQHPSVNSSTLYNLITYHQKQGHILRIRRGLYYCIPKGMDPTRCPSRSTDSTPNVCWLAAFNAEGIATA